MRLQVSRKSDLAVRALRMLADRGTSVKGPDLAAAVGTTSGFLAQVLTPLVRAGWVRSEPGPTGGYSLATELAQLSIREVIESIEGPTNSGRCVLEDRPCSEGGFCALHVPWKAARSELLAALERISVADASVGELTP